MKMLQYQNINVSEGIDVYNTMNQRNLSFLTIGFLKMLDANLKNMFVIDVMIY